MMSIDIYASWPWGGGRGRRARCDQWRRAALLAGVLGCIVPMAACSSPSPSPTGTSSAMSKGIAYSRCMRAHGVPNFPDPVAGVNGSISFPLVPSSQGSAAATQACRSLAPGGTGHGTGLSASQQQAYLSWARCIRKHGIPDFPDPTFVGGQWQPTGSADAKRNKSAFARALAACSNVIPGGSPIQLGPGA
jgi:hypothetical protein